MDYETSVNAKIHKELIQLVLFVFSKSLANVVAIFVDNVSFKRSLATLIGCHYVDLSSH